MSYISRDDPRSLLFVEHHYCLTVDYRNNQIYQIHEYLASDSQISLRIRKHQRKLKRFVLSGHDRSKEIESRKRVPYNGRSNITKDVKVGVYMKDTSTFKRSTITELHELERLERSQKDG